MPLHGAAGLRTLGGPCHPAGTHKGTLTLLLCRDPACAERYPATGNSLPYRVEVLATVGA